MQASSSARGSTMITGVEVTRTSALQGGAWDDVLTLCSAAYDEDTAPYFADIGPGTHFLLRDAGVLVSHAMLVTRTLIAASEPPMVTAYVELVATRPSHQRRGFATQLMRALAGAVAMYDIGALSPFDVAFYARLGWEPWRGPLSMRTSTGLVATPDEEVMVLRGPRTPTTLTLDEPLSIEWRRGEVW